MHDSTVIPIWIGTAKYAQSFSCMLAAMHVGFPFPYLANRTPRAYLSTLQAYPRSQLQRTDLITQKDRVY